MKELTAKLLEMYAVRGTRYACALMRNRSLIITPSTTIYLGKVGTNAYHHTALALSPRAIGKLEIKTNPDEAVFTLPVTESDYDAVHRLIDSTNDGSHRFSLCVGVCYGSEIVLYHFDEVHIVFPFPSPDKDHIQVYVCR